MGLFVSLLQINSGVRAKTFLGWVVFRPFLAIFASIMGNNKESNMEAGVGGYRRVIKYLGIFGGAQGLSVLLGMVRNKAASLLLRTGGFGAMADYNRTAQFFSDTTGLSLSLSAVRRLSDTYSNGSDDEVRHCVKVVRSIALLTGIVGMTLMLLLSPLLSQWMFDGGYDDALRLVAVAPVVFFLAVSNGELAVLRGVGQPGRIALYTLWTAVSALLVAVPLYFFFGKPAVVPVIFLVALLQMGGALFFSTKLYSYKANPFSRHLLREGLDIVKLGAGYIYSTAIMSGALWVLYQMIKRMGGDSALGIFSAGYILVGMLPSILFASFDSDYYPRLSGIFAQKDRRNAMVNEHIEVHLLVQVPVLLGVVLLLPWIFPLLFSQEFLPALQMVQLAVFALLFHVLTYPISFMPVSKGDTLVFALQETLYNMSFVLLTLFGFRHSGWLGAGMGMALARMIDLAVAYSIARFRYGFRLSDRAVKFFVMALLAGVAVMLTVFGAHRYPWLGYCGFAVVAVVAAVSLYRLSLSGQVLSYIFKRIFKK